MYDNLTGIFISNLNFERNATAFIFKEGKLKRNNWSVMDLPRHVQKNIEDDFLRMMPTIWNYPEYFFHFGLQAGAKRVVNFKCGERFIDHASSSLRATHLHFMFRKWMYRISCVK